LNITRKRILKLNIVLGIFFVCFPFVYYALFLSLIRVPSGAMANTIIPGDCMIVKKRAFGVVSRGDVIVFRYPKDPSIKYVARVVGLPGESIEVRGLYVYVNGKEIPEQRVTVSPKLNLDGLEELSVEGTGPYRVFYASRKPGNDAGGAGDLDGGNFRVNEAFQIPGNEYYVMGDNRDDSSDSRYWGTVPGTLIFGKPTMIYWSSGRDKAGDETVRWERLFTKIDRN
jgi:signal peptidase I